MAETSQKMVEGVEDGGGILPLGTHPTTTSTVPTVPPVVVAPKDPEKKLPNFIKSSDVDKRAKEIATKRELPIKPGKNCRFSEAAEWLGLLTDEQAARIIIYVYRLFPVIDRSRANAQADNNIDVISDGFKNLSEETIVDLHGGGNYMLMIKDTEFVTGKGGKGDSGVFTARLEVPISICPPKVDLREVVWEDPKNKGYLSWARAKGLIDQNNMPIISSTPIQQAQQAQTSKDEGNVAVMKTMMEFFTKMTAMTAAQNPKQNEGESIAKGITDIFVRKMEQEDPNKGMASVATLITAMNSGKKESNPMADMIPFLTMLQNQHEVSMKAQENNMKVMIELLRPRESEKEEKSQIDQLRDLMAVAREIKGGGTAVEEPQSWKEKLVDKGLGMFSELLPGVIGIVQNITAAKANAARVMGNPGVQTGVTGVQTPSPGMQPQQLPVNTSGMTRSQALAATQPNKPNQNGNGYIEPQQIPQLTQQPQPQPQPVVDIPIVTTSDQNPNMSNQLVNNQLANPLPQSEEAELVTLLASYAPLIIPNMIKKQGCEVADLIVELMPDGALIITHLTKNGVEGIIHLMKQVPNMWEDVVKTMGEPKARKWFDSFVNYQDYYDDIGDEPEGKTK